MKRAFQTHTSFSNLKSSAVLVLSATVLVLATQRSSGVEFCGGTNGSTIRDQATGSVLMAGASVVGASFSRDGTTFRTVPMSCYASPQVEGPIPDCDKNGLVGLADFGCLYECLQGPGAEPSEDCKSYDLDASGTVDLQDLRSFQNRFGSSVGQ